jgi:hypothetical protein
MSAGALTALVATTLALAAAAFGTGRALRSGTPARPTAASSVTRLVAAKTPPPSLPRLAHAVALPALRVRHRTARRIVAPTPVNNGSATSSSGTTATSGTTGTTTSATAATPRTTARQPSSATTRRTPTSSSSTDSSTSSGGNSLGG